MLSFSVYLTYVGLRILSDDFECLDDKTHFLTPCYACTMQCQHQGKIMMNLWTQSQHF